jgi:hypothetical protein
MWKVRIKVIVNGGGSGDAGYTCMRSGRLKVFKWNDYQGWGFPQRRTSKESSESDI